MLKAKDFEFMKMEKQEEYLSSEGNFIACRSHDQYYVDLYSISNFFVEVWYVNMEEAFNKEGLAEISLLTDIKTISQEKDINRYIELYENSRV
jgi:hypothetical protein